MNMYGIALHNFERPNLKLNGQSYESKTGDPRILRGRPADPLFAFQIKPLRQEIMRLTPFSERLGWLVSVFIYVEIFISISD